MGQISFQLASGEKLTVEFAAGDSVMRTAVSNDVEGIIGECGGELNCGTCHVYVDEAWQDRIPPAAHDETDMLEVVTDVTECSRLSCQITLTSDLDGLQLCVPEES
jgi:2Fe-2S ferredoxin